MAVTASLVIDFGALGESSIRAELDTKRNGNKSTFLAGEPVYFRIASEVPYSVEASSGTASMVAEDEVEAVAAEVVSFVKQATASTSKTVNELLTVTWYGTDFGALSKSGDSEVRAANADENTLGVAKITYNTRYDVWQLMPPVGMPTEYAIVVLIKAE